MRRSTACALLAFALAAIAARTLAQEAGRWPQRVLITNDNGLADPKIAALARAFAPQAETWVIAPLENRSGSTHYLSVTRTGQLVAERRELGAGIRAWAVDGYPADCVLLALHGLMRSGPPDLVISGINGGPNLAHDWLGSGTIGAARIAAYLGKPALAVSGLDDDIPGAVDAATRWVVELARTSAVRELERGQYLTVSLPRVAPSAIRGVRLAPRAGLLLDIGFEAAEAAAGRQGWKLRTTPLDPASGPGTDAALYAAGFVVVVPMRADEHDAVLGRQLAERAALPEWSLPRP
jgi:5'-nucleotidase